METLLLAINKYGIGPITIVFLVYVIYQISGWGVRRSINALDANTVALNKLSKDVRIAFHNIKKLREKAGMGDVELPPNFDQ